MDWKKKLRNKTFVVTFLTAIIAFIYQILASVGVAPRISADTVTNVIMIVVNLLATLGILVNPNTDGITD